MGGAGIERAFDTIFRPLGWAFDDTGLPGGGQFDRCQAREGGGAGIERAFDTIFRPLGWAFDDTGLPGGGEGSLIVVKPGGGQVNLSLGTKWPCHCKETGTRPRHRLVDRSNVAWMIRFR